ncbi:pimeloyl-ACP methyl ester carboxylesterase [Propionicimonas paludicola]|uniref:Pimeloyl-ACP methyl ester carboxylesterase n=1 Tax=Propionicimonas paludicola TaxID=185243 RepID=A0A2A9CP25_9ACTN|nr:alpha/beta hydrolase [Propionicimonas paludicola]PFG15835.1 pimeloyl-ACP methyl ester carboxylesterase [Propionicimonas paludicola]
MTTQQSTSPIVLIPGHWLGAWAWDEVEDHLSSEGHPARALTLPGLDPDDPDRRSRTLDDQADAIVAALRQAGASAERPAVIVGHSGANGPISLVAERHPELIGRLIWVDSGPLAPGSAFAPDAPDQLTELPLPPFDELRQQASLDGLSPEALDRFRLRAVPEPGPVLRQRIELVNDGRRAIPTTLVCCSISGAQVMELAAAGHPMFAEVATLQQVDVIDLPTGHWPMWSRPAELAQLIGAIADRTPAQ